MGFKMNIAKTKVNGCRQHPYKCEQCADRKCPRLRVLGTPLQHQGKAPGQRDTTKNHGRLGGIRQTPGYLPKQHCHLPEETGVQLLCAASYGILCRDLDTDQTSTEQTCGRTDQNGKKYAQHNIKNRRTNIWVRERTKFIYIMYTVKQMKWSWAGHINRLKDNR